MLRQLCRDIDIGPLTDFASSTEHLRRKPHLAQAVKSLRFHLRAHGMPSDVASVSWLLQRVCLSKLDVLCDCAELAWVLLQADLSKIRNLRLTLCLMQDYGGDCLCMDNAKQQLTKHLPLLRSTASTLRVLTIDTSNDLYDWTESVPRHGVPIVLTHLTDARIVYGRITWFTTVSRTPALLSFSVIDVYADDQGPDDMLAIPATIRNLFASSRQKTALLHKLAASLARPQWLPDLELLGLQPYGKALKRITFDEVEALAVLARNRSVGLQAAFLGKHTYTKLKKRAEQAIDVDFTVLETVWSETAPSA